MSESLILFDGVCNLCNGWVDFVIRRDPAKQFHFAALQSEAARRILAVRGFSADEMSGVYLVEPERILTQSGAILRIASRLKGPAKLWAVFWIVPPFLRDAVYRFVARRRTRWFGKRDTCRVPSPEEKERFL